MSLKLDEWRRLKNITQEELGNRVGVTYKTIAAWEKNPNLIKVGYIPKIAEALGVKQEDIIFLPYDTN